MCAEELPWRAQGNLLLGQCQLDCLMKKYFPTTGEMQCGTPQWLQLNSLAAKVFGVIPTDTRLIAGNSMTVETAVKPSLQMIELDTMMTYFSRAVVSSHDLFLYSLEVVLWPADVMLGNNGVRSSLEKTTLHCNLIQNNLSARC